MVGSRSDLLDSPVLEDRVCAYLEEHELLRLDADARHAKWFKILEEDPRFWILHQTWLDPEEACDWGMIVRIHLEDSKRIGRPVMEGLVYGRSDRIPLIARRALHFSLIR